MFQAEADPVPAITDMIEQVSSFQLVVYSFSTMYVKLSSRDRESSYCLGFWTSQSLVPCYFDLCQALIDCHKGTSSRLSEFVT